MIFAYRPMSNSFISNLLIGIVVFVNFYRVVVINEEAFLMIAFVNQKDVTEADVAMKKLAIIQAFDR